MHRPFIGSLAFVALISSASAERKPKSWPCYWVHGRLTVGNGTPSTRIWPSGTRRMLGLVSVRYADPEDRDEPDIPDSVADLITQENHTVWGDFYVCPVVPDRAGWMRLVVLKEARNLFLPQT